MLHQLPDQTGPLTATALSTLLAAGAPTRVNWVKCSAFTVVHSNTGAARIGDASVSSTQGCVIAPNFEVTLSPASGTNSFDLSQTYLLIPTSGDVVQISFNTV